MKISLDTLGISRTQALELLDHLELLEGCITGAIVEAEIPETDRDQVLTSLLTVPAQLNNIYSNYQADT